MTSASLAVVAPKLEKLIPLLGSDKDGEVVATVRAIGRTLNAADCDWHDLTAVLTRAKQPAPPDASTGAPTWSDAPPHAREGWLARMIASPGLTPWEVAFCGSISDQLRAGHTLSEKQIGVLDLLVGRAAEARR